MVLLDSILTISIVAMTVTRGFSNWQIGRIGAIEISVRDVCIRNDLTLHRLGNIFDSSTRGDVGTSFGAHGRNVNDADSTNLKRRQRGVNA